MEISTEVISISKIRDGIFIGDMRAGINLDLLMQFKISHIINATGMQLPYTFESIGIKYLTIEWSENPPKETNVITKDIVSSIISFIDDSLLNGEGLFGFSFNGKNRICVVIILYIMSKFHWPLKKCLEYVKKKKTDLDINTYYKNQLTEYEKKFFENSNNHIVQPNLFWKNNDLKDKNELLMSNTYLNEIKNFKINSYNNTENAEEKKYKIIRHVEWGDNKKYARQMAQPGLIHYNIDKDLFLKKDIKEITFHMKNKPLRSCIRTIQPEHVNYNINTNSSIRRKKKNTKIYLAADINPFIASKKNSASQDNKFKTEGNEQITSTKNNNMNKNENDKKCNKNENIENKLAIEIKLEEDKNQEEKGKRTITDICSENHIVNNLFITSTKIEDNDSDDDIKLNNIININNKKKENKDLDDENVKKNVTTNKKDIGFNIVNIDPQKITTNDIKPILNNLLKIDPNLQTLKKYLKANKKKAFTNFSNTFPDFKINNSNNTNGNINSLTESNNPTINTINTISNSNDPNVINLIPVHMNNNLNSQNQSIKVKNKEEKKNNGIYLLNLNLNIDNRTNFNIKNNIINNGTNSNNVKHVFNKKLNNFFMDSNGNSYFNSFNKYKNRRSNTSERKNNIKNNYLSPNVNYYLGNNKGTYIRSGKDKTENTFIPNLIITPNNYSINNPRNINKTEKNKIFMRPAINIDRSNINNMINNNKKVLMNNIANSNCFNKKESKY